MQPIKKLANLLRTHASPEVRLAAAVVLGELGVKDPAIRQALHEALEDPDGSVRLRAIRALGQLRDDTAMTALLERVPHGGEEADQAAEALVQLGARGAKALQALMPRVAPGLRRTIATALAAGGRGSEAATLHVLHDRDPAVVEAAARTLAAKIPSLASAQHRALAGELIDLLQPGAAPRPAPTEAAVVRLLALLDDPRVADFLWERIDPRFPREIRAAALLALGKWVGSPSKEQWHSLFACARENDFHVAAPALTILQKLPVPEKSLPGWIALLAAPDTAVRKLALDKLGSREHPQVIDALLPLIRHPDRDLRESTLACLRAHAAGRDALTRTLLDAESPDHAWTLARALAPAARDFPSAWRKSLLAQACQRVEAGDRRADPLLHLLREVDDGALREALEERAAAARKKKQFEKALAYLKLLARDPAAGWDLRWQLAAIGLKVSARELAPESRNADPCLHQFIQLGQQDPDALLQQIAACKWLDPEELFYLGFHCVEQGVPIRQLGCAILAAVQKRAPRTKLAQAAKSKLLSAGLA